MMGYVPILYKNRDYMELLFASKARCMGLVLYIYTYTYPCTNGLRMPYCRTYTKPWVSLRKYLHLFLNGLAGLNKIFLHIVLQLVNFLLHLHSASEEEDK